MEKNIQCFWLNNAFNNLHGKEFRETIVIPLKVYVFSDPVLCIGKMNENSQSNTGILN